MKGSLTAAAGIDDKFCILLVVHLLSQKAKISFCVLLCNFLREKQKNLHFRSWQLLISEISQILVEISGGFYLGNTECQQCKIHLIYSFLQELNFVVQ